MIQDRVKEPVQYAERKYKQLFCLASDEYKLLSTDGDKNLSLPFEQNTFTLKYKYSTPQEWIDELCSVSQGQAQKRYPFLYVNSMRIDRKDDIVEFGEIVIATLSKPNWKTTQRDEYSFRPVLNLLYDLFIDGCKVSREFSLINQGTRKDHYFYGRQGLYGGEANKFSDYVDAIEINNLKIRLYKKCYD